MEERLRAYFIRNGYYTVRAVPFVYYNHDITDIDIWLYERPSLIARHRIIVDVKNKKTPQALERIFWAKGLRTVIDVEQAVVATTDRRPDVTNFGKQHGVLVLDGNFLGWLMSKDKSDAQRLSEEEFASLVEDYSLNRLSGDWKGRLKTSKERVLHLGYDAVNHWISEGRYFAEQSLLVSTHKEVAYRLLYIMFSFISIGLDFVLRELNVVHPSIRYEALRNGFLYGSRGEAGTKQMVALAAGLIKQYAPDAGNIEHRIRRGIERDFDALRADLLADYFSRPQVSKTLFGIAREFEEKAYSREFTRPQDLGLDARSLTGALLDFWGVDRTKIFE